MKTMMAVAVLVVSACGLPGAPVVGSNCDPAIEQPECVTDKSLGVCGEDGKWRAESCDRCSNNQEIVCTHHVGESCTGSDGYCTSSTSWLICRDGKYADESCQSCFKTENSSGSFVTCT